MTTLDTGAPTRALEQTGRHDPTTGRFLPGNQAAAKHLARVAPDRWPEWLTGEVETFYLNSLADDGGDSEVPTRRKSVHRYRAQVHGLVLAVASTIKHRGITDRRGRLREIWIKRLESLISTARSLDATLGYDRRAKDAMTLSDYINAEPQQPAQAPTTAPGEAIALDREVLASPGTDAPTEAQHNADEQE